MLRKLLCATTVGLIMASSGGAVANASAGNPTYQGAYKREVECVDAGLRGVWYNEWRDFLCSPASWGGYALWVYR